MLKECVVEHTNESDDVLKCTASGSSDLSGKKFFLGYFKYLTVISICYLFLTYDS